jgi:ElaB/YqjD/DUF883 family membrane-anchored ribosome-binding protein
MTRELQQAVGMAKTSRKTARTSPAVHRRAVRQRALAKRETRDAVVVMLRRRPLQALALTLGIGLALGLLWAR